MKSALVTGGSRGIGRATVLEAAKRGYDVLFTYRDQAAADEVIAAAAETGRRVEGAQVVLEDANAVIELGKHAASWPNFSLLVNNAGVLLGGAIGETTTDDWMRSVAVNMTAPFLIIREVVDELAKHNGCIVNVSSNGGLAGSLAGASYGATKSGILGLSMSLARELAPNVRVNAIAPGSTETDMYSAAPDELKEQWMSAIPLRRVAASEEVARAILDISEWTYATGHTFVLDGGTIIR